MECWLGEIQKSACYAQGRQWWLLVFMLMLTSMAAMAQSEVPMRGSTAFTISRISKSEPVHLNVRQPKTPFYLQMPNRRQFRTLLLVTTSAYLIHRWDSEIDEDYALEGDELPFQALRWYGKVGELYDSRLTYPVILSAAVAFYGYRKLSGSPKPGEEIRMTIKALAWTSMITLALKTAIGRYRPYTNKGPYQTEFLDFYLNAKFHSFPSGHTSSIFALTTVLAAQTKSRFGKWMAYSFAASVGFQRMMDRKHWASDVIAGALIGHLVGNWVLRKNDASKDNLYVGPYANGKTVGLAFNF